MARSIGFRLTVRDNTGTSRTWEMDTWGAGAFRETLPPDQVAALLLAMDRAVAEVKALLHHEEPMAV